ncbi:MAG TPA: hypothetical protein ENI17_01450 [Pseudomonas xinjiangensis]|uniref:Uncharacterized protein n=2 Tax=root TaxID=1 RepID=A0A7V1FTM9_9GAMM|nr:hypothetical protein [Halopseudomonas xinjiangensis]HEC46283.1 hypothetical protein [Halopseudomonas xinjiangensis]
MKTLHSLAIACLFSIVALPVHATCTPEEATQRAEVAAKTINRVAAGDPEKARALHAKLQALQEREPTSDRHSACEAYDRVIAEVERKEQPDE